MADVIVVAANVQLRGSSSVFVGNAGETVTRGQVVYLKSDGKYWLADASAAATASIAGITLTGGAANQAVAIIKSGKIDLGATLTVGGLYVLSATAGAIAPFADLVSTNVMSIIGPGSAANSLTVDINNTGIVLG